MAIKGKKKSQSRGSQGQRRPAAAPRPVYTGKRYVPWYKKTEGRLIGGMLIAVVLGVAIWLIADAQNKSRERTETREALEGYVSTLRSFTNELGPVAEDMGLVAPADPDAKALRKDAQKWSTDLAAAQGQIAAVPAPDEAEVAGRLFEQSLNSFLAAAVAFETAAGAEGELQANLLGQATQERDQARALFELAVIELDAELQEVGGENSNLLLPQSQPPMPEPGQAPGTSTEVTIPGDDGGSDGGGGGGQGGGGAGGGGGGDQGDGN